MAAYMLKEVDEAIEGPSAQRDQFANQANFFAGQVAAYKEIRAHMLEPEEAQASDLGSGEKGDAMVAPEEKKAEPAEAGPTEKKTETGEAIPVEKNRQRTSGR